MFLHSRTANQAKQYYYYFLNSCIVLSFADTDFFFFNHVTEFKKSGKGPGFGKYSSVYILMFRT